MKEMTNNDIKYNIIIIYFVLLMLLLDRIFSLL